MAIGFTRVYKLILTKNWLPLKYKGNMAIVDQDLQINTN